MLFDLDGVAINSSARVTMKTALLPILLICSASVGAEEFPEDVLAAVKIFAAQATSENYNFTEPPPADSNETSYADRFFFLFGRRRRTAPLNFRLWTRQNRHREKIIFTGRWNMLRGLRSSRWQRNKPVKVIIHGFLQNGRLQWIRDMKERFLNAGDVNVVSVDWERMNGQRATPWEYAFAARLGTRVVARHTYNFLRAAGADPRQVHLVGFSLGAQVAGFTGDHFRGTIERISGLDPAAPLFNVLGARRLTKSSAVFVDVIHTSGWPLSFRAPLGHSDFYPNGLRTPMPGCEGAGHAVAREQCSHNRAYEYFHETIRRPTKFIGRQCKTHVHVEHLDGGGCNGATTAHMGEVAGRERIPGIFELRTTPNSPYYVEK